MASASSFSTLGLLPKLLPTLDRLGYETPTPIQKESIPVLMEGGDLLAQAQTGTGKTAAFALPVLSSIDTSIKSPQAIIIAPTRELAIQVSEAFQSYAKDLPGFQITPVYGGQDFQVQLRAFKRGPQVIVGTPGRVMDHLRRGSLSLKTIKMVILDEADEMLKMGFIDDVEWILEQIPGKFQTGLFSATIPSSIQKIADRYLKNPKKINIKPEKNAVEAIEQFFIRVPREKKLDVLTHYLETEPFQAAIIFARTKNCSAELADKLKARGYAVSALNGDMNQALRERVITKIKRGTLDILVATDVAARGIDVDRISHVINYDIPYDTQSYIHRIGRTGRAGRTGKALLFVTPREQRLLREIEHAINKPIRQIDPPSPKELKSIRSKQLVEKVLGVIEKSKKLDTYNEVIEEILKQGNCTPQQVAAALAYLLQQSNPIHEETTYEPSESHSEGRGNRRGGGGSRRDGDRRGRGSEQRSGGGDRRGGGPSQGARGKPPAGGGRRKKPYSPPPSKTLSTISRKSKERS